MISITAKQRWELKHPVKAKKSRRSAQMKFYWENRDKIVGLARQVKIDRRNKVFNHYGGKCKYCGYKNFISLNIDHIKEGQKSKIHSQVLYRWLVKNKFPKGFQLLCRNCNYLKHYNYIKSKQN